MTLSLDLETLLKVAAHISIKGNQWVNFDPGDNILDPNKDYSHNFASCLTL